MLALQCCTRPVHSFACACFLMQVMQLQGHLDYSFASAWHPDGLVVATGNQVLMSTWHSMQGRVPMVMLMHLAFGFADADRQASAVATHRT